MLIGVIASEITALPGAATLGAFDFVNGTYQWGATALTAADVTDKTAWIGVDGLAIPNNTSAAAAAIIYSSAVSLLASCQFSAVIEVNILGDARNSPLLTISHVTDAATGHYIQIGYWDQWYIDENNGSGGWRNPYDGTNGISNGIHRLAITRSNSLAAVSVDGYEAVTNGSTLSMPITSVPYIYLGGWGGSTQQSMNIRSLSLFNPLESTALPGLSVL